MSMKRGNEDGYPGVAAKRGHPVAPLHSDVPGQSQLSSTMQRPGNGLSPTTALAYLRSVKEKLSDKEGKYEEFLEVMRDFKALKLDTVGVIERVKQLFKGDRNLILGFNNFLPQGYAITLPPENDQLVVKKPVDFSEAICFVNKIKARFHYDDHVYKSFLEILNMYKREAKPITQVYHEVAALFRDETDLLEEFRNFLPTNSVLVASGPVIQDRSRGMAIMRQMHADRRENELFRHGDRSRERREDRDKREHDRDDDDYELDGGMHGLSTKIKIVHGTDDYIAKQDGEGIYSQESIFIGKVKDRLRNSAEFEKFLKGLLMYNSEMISVKELENLVRSILSEFPDLMYCIDEFLARCEKKDGFLADVLRKECLWDDAHHPKASKVENGGRECDDKNQDHDVGDRRSAFYGKDSAPRMSMNSDKEKFVGKPIQELDLSNCESCTPSYRLLPKNYPIPLVSHRTEIGAEVLNDHWVSVTSGSEDYSFKHMRKNQYEESLFRCEDDRFELDILLESANAAIRRVEELLDKINRNVIRTDIPIRIEEHLTALHLRCIERLYGDHGLDVMEVLRKNAALALPVILTRLKQKQEEWARCRTDFNKVWGEIYAKNYYKSLDHRSFYFKQQDSKSLSTKALLAEIKDVCDQMGKEEDAFLAVAAGNRRPCKPHMVFEYGDQEIHKDLYEFVKCYCIKYVPEHLDKVMKVWTSFLEPVLGISDRLQAMEDMEQMKAKNKNVKIGGTASTDGSPISKQYNPSRSRDDDVLRDQLSSRNNRCVDGSPEADSSTRKLGKKHSNGHAADEISSVSKRASSNERKVMTPFGTAQDHGRPKNISLGGMGAEASGNSQHEESSAQFKIEREEGELSPTGEFEDNLAVPGYSDPHASLKQIGTAVGRPCENEVDADDEGEGSVHRSSSESENATDKSGNDSGSETPEHEDCSPGGREVEGDHDNKAESEGEAEGMTDAPDEGDGTSAPFPDWFLQTVKPLSEYVLPALDEKTKDSQVFYGSDSFYVLFRLHQTLYERVQSAKLSSSTDERKWRSTNGAASTDLYSRFKKAVLNLLSGTADNFKFEDDCRATIGAQSYVLFTVDKLIYKIVKQLQLIATDEIGNKLLHLYQYENSRARAKFNDAVYHENAHVLLQDENIYRIERQSVPATRLLIQLLENGHDKPDASVVSMDPNFLAYLQKEYLADSGKKVMSEIFLKRNKLKQGYGDDELASIDRAMEGVELVNGLEGRMACSTSKIYYVFDTEDLFWRSRRKLNLQINSNTTDQPKYGITVRVQRFKSWLHSSHGL
ncbi:hypothetical protein Droror1_Dr00018504 [Drosera rotundifolia]